MASPGESKRTCSIAEAAKELSISTASVRRLIDSGKIRTIRMGRRVLIPTRVIDELCKLA